MSDKVSGRSMQHTQAHTSAGRRPFRAALRNMVAAMIAVLCSASAVAAGEVPADNLDVANANAQVATTASAIPGIPRPIFESISLRLTSPNSQPVLTPSYPCRRSRPLWLKAGHCRSARLGSASTTPSCRSITRLGRACAPPACPSLCSSRHRHWTAPYLTT